MGQESTDACGGEKFPTIRIPDAGDLSPFVQMSAGWNILVETGLRLGVNLGLMDNVEIATVNELFILTQPAHLQRLENKPLDTGERDAVRAGFIRKHLGL